MTVETEPRLSMRGVFVLVSSLGIVWQIYIVTMAFRYARHLDTLLSGLGAEAPLITRSFLATYRWWIVAPIVASALMIYIARHKQIRKVQGFLGLLAALVPGGLFQAWMNEAWFSPIFSLIQQIG